jgi:hypothetical protein
MPEGPIFHGANREPRTGPSGEFASTEMFRPWSRRVRPPRDQMFRSESAAWIAGKGRSDGGCAVAASPWQPRRPLFAKHLAARRRTMKGCGHRAPKMLRRNSPDGLGARDL